MKVVMKDRNAVVAVKGVLLMLAKIVVTWWSSLCTVVDSNVQGLLSPMELCMAF